MAIARFPPTGRGQLFGLNFEAYASQERGWCVIGRVTPCTLLTDAGYI